MHHSGPKPKHRVQEWVSTGGKGVIFQVFRGEKIHVTVTGDTTHTRHTHVRTQTLLTRVYAEVSVLLCTVLCVFVCLRGCYLIMSAVLKVKKVVGNKSCVYSMWYFFFFIIFFLDFKRCFSCLFVVEL